MNISIVLYKTNISKVSKTINSCLTSSLDLNLFLIDNSPTDDHRILANNNQRIKYIFNPTNLGFGAAHNIALKKSMEANKKYHVIINPDVYFDKGVLETLHDYMESNPDVGLVMPKILYPNGAIQYLCKLVPTPADLFFRRFILSYPYKSKSRRTSLYFQTGKRL